jgi:hypothetical protein
MYFSRFIFRTLLVGCIASFPVAPLSAVAADSESPLAAQATKAKRLQEDLDSLQAKKAAAQDKITSAQKNLSEKQSVLAKLRESAGSQPDDNIQANLDNEARRVALAELDVKFAQEAMARIDERAKTLQQEIAANRQAIHNAEKTVVASQARKEADILAQNQVMEQKLQALAAENERLKKAMEAEAKRAQQAEEAAFALEQARLREADAATKAKVAKDTKAAVALRENGQNVDLSQVVLEGEPPIYQEKNPIKMTLRSRHISGPVNFKPIGENLYQIEVDVEPGKAYFDLRNRRYRGNFAGEGAAKYRFYYDLNGEKPVLSVEPAVKPDQMISTTKDPF